MSDDEEMSQVPTQRTTQSGSIAFTSLSNVESDPMIQPWGRLNIYSISPKRLGLRGPINNSARQIVQSIGESHCFLFYRHVVGSLCNTNKLSIFYFFQLEFVTDSMSFGRKADCNLIHLLKPNELNDLSNVHFTITKTDPNDSYSPVFLKVRTNK